MKNVFFIFSFLLLLTNVAQAQCPTGNVDFFNQQQIDDFAIQYPNCTEFPGTITIMGDDIFDLRAFSNLTTVGGSVLILNCSNLTHTTGFEHVTEIGGSLIIDYNPALIDLYGFAYASSVAGNLTITNNISLGYDCYWSAICSQQDGNTNFYMANNGEGCDESDKITYTCIDIMYSPPCNGDYVQDLTFTSQAQLDGFNPSCIELIGNVTISGSDITDLSELSSMSTITGELIITNNPLLTSLEDLSGLNFMTLTNLTIENNPLLTTCNMTSLCRYIGAGGLATINNNASGCISLAEVAGFCSQLNGCPTGLHLFTQADVDNFPMLYSSCNLLSGSLHIGYGDYTASDITDLSPLSQLTAIYGDLTINRNTNLTNLNGLHNITTIGGDFRLKNNDNLQNIGLPNLVDIGEDLDIENCDALTDLTGLENVTRVGENIKIELNNNLLNIGALQNVTTAGGIIFSENNALINLNGLQNITSLNNDIWITGNNALVDISALQNLTSIGGSLNIYSTQSLPDLNGLQNLVTVGEGLTIRSNETLVDLTGLQSLASVGDFFAVAFNDNISSLSGLDNLTSIAELQVHHNPLLSDISDLNSISSPITQVRIYDNPLLSECSMGFICNYLIANGSGQYDRIDGNASGCESIATVLDGCDDTPSGCPSADVTLATQQQVNDFAAMYPNCTAIQGMLQIGQSSGSLTNITDLSPLNFVTSAGSVAVERTQLTNLTGLQGLQTVNGDLRIVLNPNLNTISALSGVAVIGGQLHIGYNKELVTLNGLNQMTQANSLRINNNNKLASLSVLSNLQTVSEIIIQNNQVLTSLDGLDNVDADDITDLTITSNPLLATCNVTSICNYLIVENGGAVVQNNAMGCNEAIEIEAACLPNADCPLGNVQLYTQAEVNSFGMTYPNCTEIQGNLILGGPNSTNDIDDLSPLSQIVSVSSFLNIVGTQLTDLSGLEQLQEARNIFIEFNTQLTNLHALSGITSLESGISVRFNRELTDLQGLEQLTEVSWLNIFNNKKLQSLTALSNLTAVHVSIIIENNEILPSLEGIENADLTAMDLLRILDNPQLTTCGYDNICNFIENNTNYAISNNATGCNSAAEVQQNCTVAVQCPTGDVTLATQQQVNDFATTYPNCTDIQGTLYIGKTSGSLSNIADLSPLSQIVSVGGIYIQRTNITDLSGLEQLQTVNGDLRIVLNPNLLNINALYGITSVDGQLHIGYNKELDRLAGLNLLTSVGSLRINNNNKLDNISALLGLQTTPEIIIQNNNILPSLAGLEDINPAQLNNLTITSNPALSDCAIDPICEYLDGQGFHLISNNTGDCATNTQVEDACMSGSTCPSVAIYLLNQQEVNDFAAMYSHCAVIDGSIIIGQSTGNLNDITDLSPLGFITQVGGIAIRRTRITDLSGLEQLQSTGSLIIELNPNLMNINALANLQSVEQQLSIGYNRELLTLDGLESLSSVGELYIREHRMLNSLEALSNLTDISSLRLHKNDVLTSLAGLENINPNTLTYIELSLHDQLSACSIAPICTHLAQNPNNNYWIIANAAGCATQAQILDNCTSAPPPDDCDTTVSTETFIFDNDLFIDGSSYENNPSITFTDLNTPVGAILSDITLEVFFRVEDGSCEEDIRLRIFNIMGGGNDFVNVFFTCDGNTGLYSATLDIDGGERLSNFDDWVIEFMDKNDQNAGNEYSVRFVRLSYTATLYEGGETFTEEVSEFADYDLFIDDVGYDNNEQYTFSHPTTTNDVQLTDILFEFYYRLNGNSSAGDIRVRVIAPNGQEHLVLSSITHLGNGLYYTDFNLSSIPITAPTSDWIVQFNDLNGQNSDYEYSVRFGRVTYNIEYNECMEMLTNEEDNEPQQLNTPSTQRLVNHNSTTIQHDNTLKLFPVPASNLLNVEYFSENTHSTNIEIISNEGKILMSQREFLQEGLNTIQLDIRDIPVGYYFIRMYDADDAQIQPFVKIAP